MSRVFLSYSSQDRSAAEALHQSLASHGIVVWRDQTRLETDWSREIAEALCASDQLCLIWSANSAQSRWVRNEWLTARALGVPIVPLILPKAPDLPKPIYNLHAIPCTDTTEMAGPVAKRLATAPAGTEASAHTTRPDHFDVPYQPIPSFVGRDADLVDLYLNLIGNLNRSGTRAVGLVGMGGAGKTQLAVELAWRFSFAFSGTWWIDASHPEAWRDQFIALAKRLHPIDDPQPLDAEPRTEAQWLAALRNYCNHNSDTLLILDNVPDPNALVQPLENSDFVPIALGCSLLFTSRHRFEFEARIPLQEIGMLPQASAYDLLTRSRKPDTPEEAKSATAICNALGNLPLALVLAAAYLRTFRDRSFRKYHQLLLQYGLEAIDTKHASRQNLATRHVAAVGATLQEQWNRVSDPDAQLLFKLAGQLPEGDLFPKARLRLLSGIGAGKTEIEMPFDEALNQLRDLSLVNFQGDGSLVALHPLVHDFSARLVPQPDAVPFRSAAATRLASAYEDAIALEQEFLQRGATQLLGDLETAVAWLGEQDAQRERTEKLHGLMNRERANLEDTAGPMPPLLFQQLQHRAVLTGQDDPKLNQDLIDSCRRANGSCFVTRATSTSEDPALLRVLQGHKGSVNAVSFLNDHQALSASSDATLILWDLDAGRPMRVLRGHSGPIHAMQVSGDGNRAVSGSDDKTLIVWDIPNARAVHTLEGHRSEVTAVGVSGDGLVGLSASDKQMGIWDLESGENALGFEGPIGEVKAMRLSPDGQIVLSGWNQYAGLISSRAGTLVLMDFESGTPMQNLRGHSSQVLSLDVDWNTRQALSAALDGTIVFWDLKTGAALQTFSCGTQRMPCAVALLPGNRQFLLGSDDGLLTRWDMETGEVVREYQGHGATVTSISVSGSGERAITASDDDTLILWDLASASTAVSARHTGPVNSVCLNGDGTRALSGSGDGGILLWDVATATPIGNLKGHTRAVARVSMSSDGKLAASSSFEESYVLVWDVEQAKVIKRLGIRLTPGRPGSARGNEPPHVFSSSISPDGRLLISTTPDATFIFWNLEKWRPRPVTGRDRIVTIVLAFSADQSRFALAWGDNSAVIWQTTGRSVADLSGHTDTVFCGALNHDGTLAVTGSRDRTAILWDVDQEKALQTFAGHSLQVNAVALTADCKRVLTVSIDKNLILWDAATGRAMNRLILESPVISLALHGSDLILGQGGGTVCFLKLLDG